MSSRTFMIFALLCSATIANAQIGAKTQQTKIHGIWHNNSFGYQMTLMLNADGSGEFDGETITFTSQANKLTIKQGSESNIYSFTLQGNSLTLSGGDLEQAIIFTRSGAQGPAQTAEPTVSQSAPDQASSSALIGSWSNYGEAMEFKANGQCVYLGQTFPYSVSGNHIILQTAQGNVIMAYVINGSQLNLTVNGKNLIYNKGKANAAAPNQPNASGNNSKLDLSLVGKWCYINVTTTGSGGSSTDACIVLNEDGTYTYQSERTMSASGEGFSAGTGSQSSDAGTWWIEGDRIYYNSQTKGQGSYQLVKRNHPKNNDPMIVLDGTAYVTFYQKPPW